MIKVECGKCLGKGYIRAFSGIKGGICFSCAGHGFKMQKNPPRKSKEFSFSFLWTDPVDPNYRDGDFCQCFWKKARTLKAAEKMAAEYVAKNGSADYRVEEVFR